MKNYSRMRMFILVALATHAPMHASPSELTGSCCQNQEISGSKEMHEKVLHQKDHREIQYARITFTKKSSEEAYLTNLKLQWKGKNSKPITHLTASLFKIKPTDPEQFQPMPDHLVSEGTWNPTTQQLTFTLKNENGINKPHLLKGVTSFSIVFVVNPELEEILKTGSFSLDASSLPPLFEHVARDKPVHLALSNKTEPKNLS